MRTLGSSKWARNSKWKVDGSRLTYFSCFLSVSHFCINNLHSTRLFHDICRSLQVSLHSLSKLLCCWELVHSWKLVVFVCFRSNWFFQIFSFYFHSKYLAFSLQHQKLHTWSQLRVISWHHNSLFLRQCVIYWEIHKLSFNPVQFLPECHHFHAINLRFLIRYFFTLWIFLQFLHTDFYLQVFFGEVCYEFSLLSPMNFSFSWNFWLR